MKEKNDELICPYCKSNNVVTKNKPGYVVMLSLLLFAIPLPFFKKNYYCFNCEKEWKKD